MIKPCEGGHKMAENKTKPTTNAVNSFLKKFSPEVRADCKRIIELMESISKQKPVMWGTAIIGFGTRHYVYESGREGDTMIVGFSPRKQAIAFYLAGGLEPLQDELSKLGKHTTGKGCLYIKSLGDVHTNILKKILTKLAIKVDRCLRGVRLGLLGQKNPIKIEHCLRISRPTTPLTSFG
jgi:hypothetical protein